MVFTHLSFQLSIKTLINDQILKKQWSRTIYNLYLYLIVAFLCCFVSALDQNIYLIFNVFPSGSWTTWIILAVATTVVGVMYRYFMFEHKSSWVLASCFLILIIWRPWNVWPNPPDTGHTQLGVCASSATRKGEEQFDKVLLSLSVYRKCTK